MSKKTVWMADGLSSGTVDAKCNMCGQVLGQASERWMGVKGFYSIPAVVVNEHEKTCPVLREWAKCKE